MNMATSVNVCNEKADKAIKAMMATVVGTALVPAHVNWALTASAMGAGVVAIGLCYDIKLTKDALPIWMKAGNLSNSLFSVQDSGSFP